LHSNTAVVPIGAKRDSGFVSISGTAKVNKISMNNPNYDCEFYYQESDLHRQHEMQE
jgi:hypothetical protein